MVTYGAYDGRRRMADAVSLAEEHAADSSVHSWIDENYFVVAVGEQKLVIDLLRKKYDVIVDGSPVGKYGTWQPAASKFEEVLTAETVADRACD